MKLRTTHNSIRIRVRKSELNLLDKQKVVEETIRFPNGILFLFALKIKDDAHTLTAELDDNNLVLTISERDAAQWINTNEVAIERSIDLANGEKLHLLVEKDFPCLDRPNEDKSDTFWELSPESLDAC